MPNPPKPLLERRKRPSDLMRLVESQARFLGALHAARDSLRQVEELIAKHQTEHSRLAKRIESLAKLSAATGP